jgi:phage tail-like protein
MRGSMNGLTSPYPIGTLLPAVYQEDPFAMRFTAAFDDVLAPVIATLDCLDAYIDPLLTPRDFLDWLASWVGYVIDENCPLARQRAVVADTAELYRRRGTLAGLRAQVELITGGQVEVVDSGGVKASTTPGDELPGEDVPRVAIRVLVDEDTINSAAVEAAISTCKPAHVLHRLEVVRA